ncbi:MAG: hypothetical protein M9884_00375 [Rhodocyclaceae bacterium]|nr:hypothetical protein [Rhodocyclaceae bacterium]MCO5095914.1 hypothetical protein [Rhodocyclaceae bacterium]MCZ7655520.1 hypothetical protein [Rhodocyclaceae bacterium]
MSRTAVAMGAGLSGLVAARRQKLKVSWPGVPLTVHAPYNATEPDR